MGPYKKEQNSDAIDDGWTVTDGDGNVIAHLDTETMADILLNGLNGEIEPIGTKFVQTITVTDPDSKLPVEVEIRKMETGAMVGLDESFLGQDIAIVYSPYDRGVQIVDE